MRRKNVHAQLVDELGRQISTGAFPPGHRIPPEPVLASAMGVSRIAVREAVKSLASKGMMSIRTKVGTHVAPRGTWNLFDPQILEWHFSDAPDARLLADLIELRRMIEPAAARLASARATAEDIAALRAAMAMMRAARTDHDAFLQADLAFHEAILVASHNEFVSQMRAPFAQVLRTSLRASQTRPVISADAIGRHERILAAIERHDGAAALAAAERVIDLAAKRITDALAARSLRGRQ